jgi:hypothetical protein
MPGWSPVVRFELGFHNFDGVLERGAAALSACGFRPALAEFLQGFARSSDALATIEELPPDSRGILLGGALRWRPAGGLGAVRAQYEREIRQDRAGLYSERASAAATLRVGRARLSSEVVYDFAAGVFNEARLRARHPIGHGMDISAEGRHSAPFFPLWTIWGTFSRSASTDGGPRTSPERLTVVDW